MAASGKQVGGRAVSYLSVRRGRPPASYGSGHSTTQRYADRRRMRSRMRLQATLMLASGLCGTVGLPAQDLVQRAEPCPRAPIVLADSVDGPLYRACQASTQAQLTEPTLPRFPDILRSARVEGTARVEFIVGPDGRVDQRSIRVFESTHVLFALAVRQYLAGTVWRPAQREGYAVRQLSEVEYVFRLRSSTEARCTPASVSADQALVCAIRAATVRCSGHGGCDSIP